MAENSRKPRVIRRPTTKSCEFITDMDDGFVINLDGFRIRQIRLVQNRPNQHYSILVKDADGWVYRIKKITELGNLFENNTRMKLEEVICT